MPLRSERSRALEVLVHALDPPGYGLLGRNFSVTAHREKFSRESLSARCAPVAGVHEAVICDAKKAETERTGSWETSD